MAIAATFQRYLDQHVMYDVIAHGPTMSAMRTAEACHIPGDCLAKGVVLRDDSGYMLAVLPATHHIRLRDLRLQFGNDVDLAGEGEIDKLFHDCAHGAILPIGECCGLDTIRPVRERYACPRPVAGGLSSDAGSTSNHLLHPSPFAQGFQLPDFYSGATDQLGCFTEGFLPRRLQLMEPSTVSWRTEPVRCMPPGVILESP